MKISSKQGGWWNGFGHGQKVQHENALRRGTCMRYGLALGALGVPQEARNVAFLDVRPAPCVSADSSLHIQHTVSICLVDVIWDGALC